ncbi:MAPEG family protein [Pseudoxanthomonas taiwanensis]|uniref:MAPEG family protein n=1 Tax=Pseudoxanthomonas taiwanensis TaxID=176598 RepID=UPI0011BD8BBB
MIWTIYAALLSLFFAFLTFRTIRLRQRYRVSLGHGKNLLLMRAIRVHGNFAEYVPLGLLLMAASEQLGAPSLLVHSLGSLLALGRLVHAYGVSQENEVLRFRVTGMALTLDRPAFRRHPDAIIDGNDRGVYGQQQAVHG